MLAKKLFIISFVLMFSTAYGQSSNNDTPLLRKSFEKQLSNERSSSKSYTIQIRSNHQVGGLTAYQVNNIATNDTIRKQVAPVTGNVKVESHNQTGGVTAYQVNINRPRKILDTITKKRLIEAIDERLKKHSLTKSQRITISSPSDGETQNYGKEIIKFLVSQGYNVWQNLNWYMGNNVPNNLDIMFDVNPKENKFDITLNLVNRIQ